MVSYIIRRLLLLPVVMIGVSLLIFALVQMMGPYKRLALYVDENMMSHISGDEWDELVTYYGLDRPMFVQYGNWLWGVLHGNLGYSKTAQMPVLSALGKYLPATAELALLAVIPIVLFAMRMGVYAAVHQNKLGDHATRIMAITGWSIPTFVMGLTLLLIFYGFLGLFPPGRLSVWTIRIVRSADWTTYTGMNLIDSLLNGQPKIFLDALSHLILPVITLAYISWALILRVMRSSMLETLRQDYITTARAKGVKERVVIRKHAQRNAMIPVVTLAGMAVAGLLGGVVITETIFNYPGLGRFAAQAAIQIDTPAVLGFALFNAILMVGSNLAVDVLYGLIDPRIRLD
ncbi:ABC transporter permease [Candidatus Bipolaricaulota bacterium]